MIAQVQPVILDDMYGNYEFDVKLSNIRIKIYIIVFNHYPNNLCCCKIMGKLFNGF